MRLVDEFGELLAKLDKTEAEQQLVELCTHGVDEPTVSRVPFTLLVSSYQAALKNVEHTVEIIGRTEYADVARQDAETVKRELSFIGNWLQLHAPEDVKFELTETVAAEEFNDAEKAYLKSLADKIEAAPKDADGAWFHVAIYEFKESSGLPPKDLFTVLYRAIRGKDRGPRAGWFLSILPRDWLIRRLRLEK
jgi:lysyl-tRNA synthetase class 1